MEEKKSNGAIVGLIVILVILIIGGIYVWQSKLKKTLEEKKKIEAESSITSEDSAQLNTLEQDLNATDTNVGVDVNTIQ